MNSEHYQQFQHDGNSLINSFFISHKTAHNANTMYSIVYEIKKKLMQYNKIS